MSTYSANSANSLLIYHCGVSVNMDYGHGASSASLEDAEYALQTYFGFKDQAVLRARNNHPLDWKSILRANLNKGWPIIYQGQDDVIAPEDCHAWVIDGYDSNDNFYCNWGWEGNSNGYFSLGGLTPKAYNFTELQKALVDIEPQRSTPIGTPQLSPQSFTFNPNGYNLTIPAVDGATSYQWITDRGTITGTGTTANLKSDCSATVQVRAFNNQCGIYSTYATGQVTINYGPISGTSSVCSSGNTFTITNLPPSVNSIEWIPGPGLTITSGKYSASCTFSATGSINSWVKASVVNTCGQTVILPQKNVTGGVTASFTGNTSITYGGSGTWNATASGCTPPYHYEWWLREDTTPPVGAILVGEGSSLTLWSVPRSGLAGSAEQGLSDQEMLQSFGSSGSTNYYLSLQAFDANGMMYNTQERLIVAYGDVDLIDPMAKMAFAKTGETTATQMKISPNPASDEATVELFATEAQRLESSEWQVEIYDPSQMLKTKIQKINGNKQSIRTAGWKEGVYIVRAKIGNEVLTDKLVIKP